MDARLPSMASPASNDMPEDPVAWMTPPTRLVTRERLVLAPCRLSTKPLATEAIFCTLSVVTLMMEAAASRLPTRSSSVAASLPPLAVCAKASMVFSTLSWSFDCSARAIVSLACAMSKPPTASSTRGPRAVAVPVPPRVSVARATTK